jgi:hypothetical protein
MRLEWLQLSCSPASQFVEEQQVMASISIIKALKDAGIDPNSQSDSVSGAQGHKGHHRHHHAQDTTSTAPTTDPTNSSSQSISGINTTTKDMLTLLQNRNNNSQQIREINLAITNRIPSNF